MTKSLKSGVKESLIRCIELAQALEACLSEERRWVIEFRTEMILENNLKKEELLRELVEKRNLSIKLLASDLCGKPATEALDQDSIQELTRLNIQWKDAWQSLYKHCESNQSFLKHSLKNTEELYEDLTRAFTQTGTYSSKGIRNESMPSGNVVRGSY